MQHKPKLPLVLIILIATIIGLNINEASARAADSLRVGNVIKGIKTLTFTIQDSIISNLQGDEKKNMKEMVSQLKEMLKKSENQFKDTMQTDFKKISDEEKTALTGMEKQILKIKSALSEKSKGYHLVALGYLPVYRAIQEMRTDGRTPLLSTYKEIYNPNTTTNNQVTMVGAYLNFYLEYRITVGGITIGPDIVDPERLVFTFPEKLLDGLTEPAFIEVKAAPQKETITGGKPKYEDHPEQTAYVLVYPKKK
jgi:hypothetical protein